MRRAADLYAGSAKTDPRDAWVLADFARRNADRLTWLDVGDELLLESRVLNGRDVDLATDANRIIDCTRDALTAHNNTSSRSLQPMQVPATVSGMATRPSGSDQADIAHSEGAPWVKMVDAVAAPAFESVFVL